MKALAGLLCACFALAACPPPAPMPPGPDATDAVAPPSPEAAPPIDATPPPPKSNVCVDACATAKHLGCPEGDYADCSLTCAKILADVHQVHFDPAAIAAAKTQADVRAAGWSCTVKK
jgi:hypothetical protein